MQTTRKEILHKVALCDDRGRLNPAAMGWSRRPLHVCNLRGHFPRKKKWDYWCVTGDRFLFSATIAHIDYLSLGAAYLLEYDTRRFAEHSAVKIVPREPRMPETVAGQIAFDHRGTHMEFDCAGEQLRLEIRVDSFGGIPLDATIDVLRPLGHDTLNVVVPWNCDRFQFTSKQQCLAARGVVQWGDERLAFAPGAAYACLDFGRGVWPYCTAWNWAAFSGRSGDDIVGINMGAKWTDRTGMNENGIVVNGRLHKIYDDIEFDYDDRDFMRPWKMTTRGSDAVRLVFTPFYDKISNVNLFLVRSKVHQLFGHYSGTLRVDGRAVRVDNILGWAEEHRARW